MPRIHTIVTDTTVQDVDILVGSDGDSTKGNVTRNYTVGSLKTHMLTTGVDGSFSGNLTVGGNISVTGNATIDGNLTFGNADTDTVAFGADIVSNIIPDVTDTYSLGTSSKKWKEIHLSGLQTSGIDFADNAIIRFGTGNDLQIYHDNTHSYIKEVGDGDLRIESTGSVVVKSPVGAAADFELWADNGSNHSDVWKLTAQTDNVFEIQTRDGGSFAPVMELSASDKKVYFKGDIYVPGNLELNNITVKAGQDEAAQIELKADAGDNNSDHWKLSAEADNVFEIQTRDSGSYAPVLELSASDKRAYFKGSAGIYVPGPIENSAFKIPNAIGSAGQVLKVPSSGNTLEWGSASALAGIQEGSEFYASVLVGSSTTGTLNNARLNVGVGVNAMRSITEGDSNVAIGYNAAGLLTVGDKNIAIGDNALAQAPGSNENVAIGHYALYSQDATNNAQSYTVAIGMRAGYLIEHDQPFSTIIGAYAGDSITTGQYNTIIGSHADTNAATDEHCLVIGELAIGHGSNIAVIGSGNITAWHPGDDNGVDLGSTSYSFKDAYVQGRVNAGNYKIDALNTAPSSASDTGTVGEIRYTADYVYVCVASNTWKRAALSTW